MNVYIAIERIGIGAKYSQHQFIIPKLESEDERNPQGPEGGKTKAKSDSESSNNIITWNGARDICSGAPLATYTIHYRHCRRQNFVLQCTSTSPEREICVSTERRLVVH